jgi:hypothetical protein
LSAAVSVFFMREMKHSFAGAGGALFALLPYVRRSSLFLSFRLRSFMTDADVRAHRELQRV